MFIFLSDLIKCLLGGQLIGCNNCSTNEESEPYLGIFIELNHLESTTFSFELLHGIPVPSYSTVPVLVIVMIYTLMMM